MTSSPFHMVYPSGSDRSALPALVWLAYLLIIGPSPLYPQSSGDPAVLSYQAVFTLQSTATLLEERNRIWERANSTRWGPDRYVTEFRALWNEQGLYLHFDLRDDHPWATYKRRDDPIWEEEVVAILLDPVGVGLNYAEIEISPANIICDVLLRKTWPQKDSEIQWNFKGLQSMVFLPKKTTGNSEDWKALLFLPWGGFRSLPSGNRVSLPPKPGDQWRFNLFRIKRPGGTMDAQRDAIYAAWSSAGEPSFHVSRAFRPLIFVK